MTSASSHPCGFLLDRKGGRLRPPFSFGSRLPREESDPVSIKTARLRLRPLTPSDAGDIATLAGDWDVARMTGRIRHPYSLVDADQWISKLSDDEFVRGVELDGKLIGAVGYVPNEDGSAEIGYWIGKPYWGHGFATEATRALMDHCFKRERRPRLTCGHFADNPASARVIAKLRFRPSAAARAGARRAKSTLRR